MGCTSSDTGSHNIFYADVVNINNWQLCYTDPRQLSIKIFITTHDYDKDRKYRKFVYVLAEEETIFKVNTENDIKNVDCVSFIVYHIYSNYEDRVVQYQGHAANGLNTEGVAFNFVYGGGNEVANDNFEIPGLELHLANPSTEFYFRLKSKTKIPSVLYKAEDKYTVGPYNSFRVSRNVDEFIYVNLYRDPRDSVISTGNSVLLLNKLIQYPKIYIHSQTLIDGTDIGDTIFIVEYENSKINKFEKSCPKVVSVLKGGGCTALEKSTNIHKLEPNNLTYLEFANNLIEYSMVRYFLSKLLYGTFNVEYLLGKYYHKFLKDLSKSQYYHYVDFFTTGQLIGYDKYFLYE